MHASNIWSKTSINIIEFKIRFRNQREGRNLIPIHRDLDFFLLIARSPICRNKPSRHEPHTDVRTPRGYVHGIPCRRVWYYYSIRKIPGRNYLFIFSVFVLIFYYYFCGIKLSSTKDVSLVLRHIWRSMFGSSVNAIRLHLRASFPAV